MNSNNSLPLILLAFANDELRYLRGIGKEMANLETLLEPLQDRGFEVKLFPYLESGQFLDYLNGNQERLVLLHFAGHSSNSTLQLDEGELYIKGLAAKLGACPHLQLVVLNGCANAAQVHALRAAHVPAVIGTHTAIDDQIALEFSQRFYRKLAENGLSIAKAFAESEQDINTHHQTSFRSLDDSIAEDGQVWAWFLEPADADWKLIDAAEPCQRLPPLPPYPLPIAPLVGLRPYREEHAGIFFGRCNDVLKVIHLLNGVMTAHLLLVHGSAGVGKSSFLAAGLLPHLKANGQQASYWRYNELDPDKDKLEQIFGSTVPERISVTLDQPSPAGLPAVWIIDQMEEAFLAQDDYQHGLPAALAQLLETLSRVFDPQNPAPPRAKIVLALRNEWFASLMNASDQYALGHVHYALGALDKAAIIQVICSPAERPELRQHYQLQIEPPGTELAAEIADDLLADPLSNVAPALQIILSRLWEQVKTQKQRVWKKALYDTAKREQDLLGDYLNRQLDEVVVAHDSWGKAAQENGLLLDVLFAHTSPQGTSQNLSVTDYEKHYQHIPYRRDVLAALIEHFLLITPDTDSSGHSIGQTRLIHDTLAPLIIRRYHISRASGQRARRILEGRKQDWSETGGQWHGPTIGYYDLKLVMKGQYGMADWHQNPVESLIIQNSQRRIWKRRWLSLSGFLLTTLAILITGLGLASRQAAQDPYKLLARAYHAEQAGEKNQALLLALHAAHIDHNNKHTSDIYRAISSFLADQPNINRKTPAFTDIQTVALSPKGKLAVLSDKGTTLTLFDINHNTLHKIGESHPLKKLQAGLKYSPKGELFLISKDKHDISFWHCHNPDIQTIPMTEKIEITRLEFSPAGRVLIISTQKNSLYLWDNDDDPPKPVLMDKNITLGIARFLPDSENTLVVADPKTGKLHFVDADTGKSIREMKLSFGTDYLRPMPGNKLFAWNQASSQFEIYDINQQQAKKTQHYSHAEDDRIIINQKQPYVLSYSSENPKAVTLWNTETLKEDINRFFLPDPIRGFDSEEGKYIAFENAQHEIYIRNFTDFTPANFFKAACEAIGTDTRLDAKLRDGLEEFPELDSNPCPMLLADGNGQLSQHSSSPPATPD
jgi:WD40 repeat protein